MLLIRLALFIRVGFGNLSKMIHMLSNYTLVERHTKRLRDVNFQPHALILSHGHADPVTLATFDFIGFSRLLVKFNTPSSELLTQLVSVVLLIIRKNLFWRFTAVVED